MTNKLPYDSSMIPVQDMYFQKQEKFASWNCTIILVHMHIQDIASPWKPKEISIKTAHDDCKPYKLQILSLTLCKLNSTFNLNLPI